MLLIATFLQCSEVYWVESWIYIPTFCKMLCVVNTSSMPSQNSTKHILNCHLSVVIADRMQKTKTAVKKKKHKIPNICTTFSPESHSDIILWTYAFPPFSQCLWTSQLYQLHNMLRKMFKKTKINKNWCTYTFIIRICFKNISISSLLLFSA